jgi:hypothetical protein
MLIINEQKIWQPFSFNKQFLKKKPSPCIRPKILDFKENDCDLFKFTPGISLDGFKKLRQI